MLRFVEDGGAYFTYLSTEKEDCQGLVPSMLVNQSAEVLAAIHNASGIQIGKCGLFYNALLVINSGFYCILFSFYVFF